MPDASPRRRGAGAPTARVGWATRSLALLIPYKCDPLLPNFVQIALLEAWFNDYRLPIEFLTFKPAKKTARAKDFVEGWAPPSEAKKVLPRDYGVVSQSVSHIGEAVPSEPGEVDPPGLRSKAALLFKVLEAFVDALDSEDPYTEVLRLALKDGRTVLASQV